MAVFTYGWCRIEGNKVPDLHKEYGDLINLPSMLGSSLRVFYGNPEIQIFNKLNVKGGVVYKVVPVSEIAGYESIKEIDGNWHTLLSKINSYDKSIDVSDNPNSANYYYEPFVINESCVIFYDNADRATTTANTFSYREIILVDEYATPDIIAIAGAYIGPPIPVGETYELKHLDMYVIYADGNKAMLRMGFTVSPADQIITVVGSNMVNVYYTTPKGVNLTCSVIVPGIKNLQRIKAMYDGPKVGIGREALRKYFIVIAYFSDGSSVTVSDFSFPSGNIVTEANGGVISIYYKGFYDSVTIPSYDVTTSRLIAYYNGPNVEVGHDFNSEYCNIKIYYQASDGINSHYEDIEPKNCTFTPTAIDHEGVNYITVEYTGRLGKITTKMVIIGIVPEVKLNFITAEYTGPEITVGKMFSAERVICKAHYSDGSIVTVRNFSLDSNIVTLVGPNEYKVAFRNKDDYAETTITITGLAKESTTESGYSPIYLDNNYPEAVRRNNRYRGPAEGDKHNDFSIMLYENITKVYKVFAGIEKEYNEVVKRIQEDGNIKVRTLNTVEQIEDNTSHWLSCKDFAAGSVKKGEKDE